MSENTNTNVKRKRLRVIPFFSSILIFMYTFFGELPIGSFLELMGVTGIPNYSLYLFEVDGYLYFPWGIIKGSSVYNTLSSGGENSLLFYIIWFPSLCALILTAAASSYKISPVTAKRAIIISALVFLMNSVNAAVIYYGFLYSPGTHITPGAGLLLCIITTILLAIEPFLITDYTSPDL